MTIFAVMIVTVLVAFDQLTKFFAVKYLSTTGTTPIIKNIFNLTLVHNEGAAFGIMRGARWLFVALTVIILVSIVFYYRSLPKEKPYGWLRVALVLISAGAIGNMIDRTLNGFVIDFLQVTFIDFPVFNFADICVVLGTSLMAVLLIFVVKDNKANESTKKIEDAGSQHE